MRHDYSFGPQLGRGSFGVVFQIRRKSDGLALVCKQIELSRMDRKAREDARREVAVLERVSSGSQYIVQYHASFLEDEVLHIIMEFCEHGDLSRFLKGQLGKLIDERTIWKFLIQIGLGLRWLHCNRILHRDIKTLNVFLTSADHVRLGDLGVARVMSQNTQFADTFVGTPYYLSPELCEEKPYNELSDVWAYGCVVYEMSTLRHPFEAKNQAALLIKILRGKYAPISDSYSSDLKILIEICMKHDYTKRKKLADLLLTPAVKNWAERLSLAVDNDGGRSIVSQAQPQPRRRFAHAKTAGASGFKTGAAVGLAAPGRPAPRAIPRAENRGPQDRMPKAPAPKQTERCLAQPPEGLRVRERRPCERRGPAGRRSLVDQGPAPSNTIVAPVSRIAAVHNVPLRKNARRSHAGSPVVVSTPRRVRDSAAERRRAAREVADLPDTVVPQVRPSRNAPSVHQLMQLDPEPVERPVSQSSSGGGSSVLNRTNWAPKTTSPGDVLAAELAAAEQEATLLPEDATQLPIDAESEVEENVEAEGPEEDQEEEAVQEEAEEIHTEQEQETAKESEDEPSHEDLSSATGQLQSLHVELTCYSAFGSALGEDTLAYSIEDTLASQSFTRRSQTEPCPLIDVEKPFSDGLDGEDACCVDETQDEPLQAAAEVNGHGLLCDAPWMAGPLECHWTVNADTMEDAMIDDAAMEGSTEGRSTSASPVSAINTAAGADAQCPGTSGSVYADAEERIVALEEDVAREGTSAANQESAPPAPPASMQPVSPVACPLTDQVIGNVRPKVDRAALKAARLSAQVLRLHADIAKNLDPEEHAVWEELYQLFRAKMSVDLTDEDQSEIERFVFERLPTKSTDLVLKVYKILHLEQERDRYQLIIAAT